MLERIPQSTTVNKTLVIECIVWFIDYCLETKKDPGIPNEWPFKEELLNEIQQQKIWVKNSLHYQLVYQ